MADASRTSATASPGKRPEEIAKSPDFFLLIGALAAVLLLAAFAIWLAGRWRKRTEIDDNAGLTLTNFRQMFENGEITQAEYEKIRLKMAAKMKSKLGVEPPAAPPIPPASPPIAPPKSE